MRNWFNPKNTKYHVLITIGILCIGYYFMFDFLRLVEFDTPSYIGGARKLFGLPGGYDYQSRLTKPLVLVLPGLLELLFQIHPSHTILAQNILAFFICGIGTYSIIYHLFKSQRKAYWAMFMYLTCQPVAVYSMFITVDTVGWAFGVLAIFLTLRFVQQLNKTINYASKIGALVAVGCLCKESAIIGLIFLFCYLIFLPISFLKKVKALAAASIGFMTPWIFALVGIYMFNGDSLLHRVNDVRSAVGEAHYWRLKQVMRMMDVYWFLVPIGIYALKITWKNNNQKNIVFATLLALVIAIIGLPVWPLCLDRILFLTFPLFLIIICFGLDRLDTFLQYLLPFGAIVNVTMAFMIYRYQVKGILLLGYSLFAITMFIGLIFGQKSVKQST